MSNELHEACEQGNLNAVKRLVEVEGYDFNQKHDKTNLCPIYYAARRGKVSVIGYILGRAGISPDLPNQKFDVLKLAHSYDEKAPNLPISNLIAGLEYFRNSKEYHDRGREQLESLFILPARLNDLAKRKFAWVLKDLAGNLDTEVHAEARSEISGYTIKLFFALSNPTAEDLISLTTESREIAYACNVVSIEATDNDVKLNYRLKSIQTLKNIPPQYRQHMDDYYEEYSLYVKHLAIFLEKYLSLDDPRYIGIARIVKKEYMYLLLHGLDKEQSTTFIVSNLQDDVIDVNRVLVSVKKRFPDANLDEPDLKPDEKAPLKAPAAAGSVGSKHPRKQTEASKGGYPRFQEHPEKRIRKGSEESSEEISASPR